ncbi:MULTISPECIES: hypothetical protein [Paraburkholderia]|uniref:hypothetical protein n=1 Tax=Paraburkholderia TaxID=1822464 RepID=UPI0032186F59
MLVDELIGSHLNYWVAQAEQRNTDVPMQGPAQPVRRFFNGSCVGAADYRA